MLTTVAAGRVFDYSFCLGMYGMSGQGFWTPQDFDIAADGTVFILNRGAEELGQRVSKVTLDHEFLDQFGGYGQGDGQFIWPRSIILDRAGRVYTSDDFLNRISVFEADGTFVSSWGSPGSGEGQLAGPAGLAFDADEHLLVVDSMNHRVQKFTKDGASLGSFGQHGDGDGQFNLPWGICVDGAGSCLRRRLEEQPGAEVRLAGQVPAQFRGLRHGPRRPVRADRRSRGLGRRRIRHRLG